jgi:thioester reductase-like protein
MEAHGTGTPVGDPIECTALGRVLSEGRPQGEACWIGSVKGNLGHLESGSGMPGLIKAALVLERNTIPPNVNCQTPNPNIDFAGLGLKVVTDRQSLPHPPDEPGIAAVNSFGFGGTNAHLVLESPPQVPRQAAAPAPARRPLLLAISARHEESLREYAKAYRRLLRQSPDALDDICWSAGAAREHHSQRLVVTGHTGREMRERLSDWLLLPEDAPGIVSGLAASTTDPLVYVFTGQGAQWWGMGRQLLQREPLFRQTLEQIDALFVPLSGWSLVERMQLQEDEIDIDRTDVAQPLIFALQTGLAELWRSWGLRPAAVLGHSVGEVAAAYCAGIYSLSDAVGVIFHRSRLQETTCRGSMLAAGISARELRSLTDDQAPIELAAINSESLITVAGDDEPLESLACRLEQEERFVRRLPVQYAFHTRHMDPIHDELLEALRDLTPQASRIPFVSTVTSNVVDGAHVNAGYWWQNVRRPVLFGPAMSRLVEAGYCNFLEIGPHPALRSSIQAAFGTTRGAVFHSLRREADESQEMITNLAKLHVRGFDVDWKAVTQSGGNLVQLPRYPWRKEKFWLDCDPDQRSARLVSPLLGIRVPGTGATWELPLDPRVLPYLQDHQLWDGLVFPGAGFAEMGLALARELFPEQPHVVEDLQIHKALFLSADTPPTVRVTFDAGQHTFEVFSRSDPQTLEWERHAEGRLVPLATAARPSVDLQELRQNLPRHAGHDDFYEAFTRMGFDFGPQFQRIRNLWCTAGTALAEIAPVAVEPANEAPTGQPQEPVWQDDATAYVFHPAVMDACFQASWGVIEPPQDGRLSPQDDRLADQFYLPTGVRRVQVWQPRIPERIWAHARLRQHDGKTFECDIAIYDDEGRHVADIAGFRATRMESRQDQDSNDLLYRWQWTRQRVRGAGQHGDCNWALPAAIAEAAETAGKQAFQELKLDGYFNGFLPQREELGLQLVENAMVELGWPFANGSRFTLNEFCRELDILDRHRQLARADAEALERAGLLRREGSGWVVLRQPQRVDFRPQLDALRAEFPQCEVELDLLQSAPSQLAGVLIGEVDPLNLLFPAGSGEVLERAYREGADFQACYRIMQQAVATALAALPPRRAIRVLEVGAGTGSLTPHMLAALPTDRTEYVFSDISPVFLTSARERFADQPGVEFHKLDIERAPEEQGFARHSFDLVVASNVLHATSDLGHTLANLQQYLAPSGLLLFLELVQQRIAWDNVFGLLPGWWAFSDRHLRQHSALLGRRPWEALLEDQGFQGARSLSWTEDDTLLEHCVFMAFAPQPEPDDQESAESVARQSFLLLANESHLANDLRSGLVERGHHVVLASSGNGFCQVAADEFVVDPTSPRDLQRVLSCLPAEAGDWNCILHCWSLDHPAADELDGESLLAVQRTGTLSELALVQALDARGSGSPRVYVITRDAQQVLEGDGLTRLASSPMVGLTRVANSEYSDNRWTSVDLDGTPDAWEVQDLLDEILIGDRELEVAYRQGTRWANRLVRATWDDFPPKTRDAVQADGSLLPYRLETGRPGVLDHLALHETPRTPSLEPHEVEVRVRAGGINFRDVMKALGMYPGNPVDLLWFGDDFSGIVERVGEAVTDLHPGDEVAGMAPYCFQSSVVMDRRLVFRKPSGLSFIEAATLPTVFLTSHYAICHLARMRPGEKILIHAGSGGVGQAAIQISQGLGLEVFATAGTPEKRAFLRELGVPHVMNSRDLQFADQIQEITGGRGVDAVLNSLAGEFIPKSFSVLAPFGRFLEIGKIDIYKNSRIGLQQLKDNISYFVIDLAQLLIDRPDRIGEMFEQVREKFDSGEYGPLSHQVFPVTEVVQAFRYMAQGKHMGKNVLSFVAESIPVQRCTQTGHGFAADASYLITGGAGGLGLELARWMVAEGARHVVLMSRSGPRDDDARQAIQDLRNQGAEIVDARGDVTVLADVQTVIDRIQDQLPPLKGVLHGAMVLDDDFLVELDPHRFQRALVPKMLGAWNLHQATRQLTLDHFVCFSSFSAVLGAPKQGNYNAGNVFLEALVRHRRSLELPGMAIGWGAIRGAGFVERNQQTAAYLEQAGLLPLQVSEVQEIYGDLLAREVAHIGVSRTDWSLLRRISPVIDTAPAFVELTRSPTQGGGGAIKARLMAADPANRMRILEEYVAEQVAGVFGMQAPDIDHSASLTSLGLDSLMAVELMNRVEGQLGLKIPMAIVLKGPSISDLAEAVLKLLDESDARETEGSGSPDGAGLPQEDRFGSHPRQFPLSATQQGLLRHGLESNENIICGVRLNRILEPAAVGEALRLVAERHPMIRARFQDTEAGGQQATDGPLPMIRHLQFESIEQACDRLGRICLSCDAERGTVAGLYLVDLPGNEQILAVALHPAIADDRSAATLLEELLGHLIESGDRQESATCSYREHVFEERKFLQGSRAVRTRDLWQTHLAGASPGLSLPFAAAGLNDASGRALACELPPDLVCRLASLSAAYGVDLSTTLLTAFQLLLHACSGREQLLVGYRFDGRPQPEANAAVGPFDQHLPLHSNLGGGSGFADLLAGNHEHLTAVASRPTMSAAWITEQLGLTQLNDNRRTAGLPELPLFRAAFELHESPLGHRGRSLLLAGRAGYQQQLQDVCLQSVDLPSRSIADLHLKLAEADGRLLGWWHFNPAWIRPAAVARLQSLFNGLLQRLVESPNTCRKDEVALTNEERQRVKAACPGETQIKIPASGPIVDFEQEAALDPEITPPPVSTAAAVMREALLTGATGFLGAFLLEELLTRTEATITCLVRAEDAESGLQRVQSNLRRYGLTCDVQDRLRIVTGDLNQRFLGLSNEEFDELGERIDVIYHNGAMVNLALAYDSMQTNVTGTREVLRLACHKRVKEVHLVSTFTVHATPATRGRLVREDDPLPPCPDLLHGYAQSKWVSEQLACAARDRGVPVKIYRPGHITGHSVSGASNQADLLHSVALASWSLGILPTSNVEFDITPVDYVARSIVYLSRQTERQDAAYHLTNPQPIRYHQVAEWMAAAWPQVEHVSREEWQQRFAALAAESPEFQPIAEVVVPNIVGAESLPAVHPRYDCRLATDALQGSGITCPPAADLLPVYSSYLNPPAGTEVPQPVK